MVLRAIYKLLSLMILLQVSTKVFSETPPSTWVPGRFYPTKGNVDKQLSETLSRYSQCLLYVF